MSQRQLASVLFAVLGVFIAITWLPQLVLSIGVLRAGDQAAPGSYAIALLVGAIIAVILAIVLVLIRVPLAEGLFSHDSAPLAAQDTQLVALSVLGCYFVVASISRLVGRGRIDWSAVTQLVLGVALFLGPRGAELLGLFRRVVPPLSQREFGDYKEALLKRFKKGTDDGVEAAAALVQRSLDLQVTKAGGLLAYNGLVAAIALVLWTRDLPLSVLELVMLGLLLASSLLSLFAIISLWAPPDIYKDATKDLESSIWLAARRALFANLAIFLSMAASLMIALWIGFGSSPVPTVRIATPRGLSDTTALLVRPADTLRVHCQEREGTRAAPNTPPGDRMDCVVTH